jgi:methionyl-tRNA formyltransferase
MNVTLLGDPNILSVGVTVSRLIAVLGSEEIKIVSTHESCSGGDFLFALSYPKVIPKETRGLYGYCFVLHGSSLPDGRGWSPIAWQIVEGQTLFAMSLIHMSEPIDSGKIVDQKEFEVKKNLLFDEISQLIGHAQADLIEACLRMTTEQLMGAKQVGTPSYFGRRSPSDSEIDPHRPLSEQWDILRIADPSRYPAFFSFLGHKYLLKVERYSDD